MVREARRQRRLVDGGLTDWVVVRNRLSTLGSRNKRLVGEGIDELGRQLGFRAIDGFAERVVYREFFPRGLTALDDLNEDTLGQRPNLSHVTAREEVKALIDALKLPLDERGKRRAAARAEWIRSPDQPLETHDCLPIDLQGWRVAPAALSRAHCARARRRPPYGEHESAPRRAGDEQRPIRRASATTAAQPTAAPGRRRRRLARAEIDAFLSQVNALGPVAHAAAARPARSSRSMPP